MVHVNFCEPRVWVFEDDMFDIFAMVIKCNAKYYRAIDFAFDRELLSINGVLESIQIENFWCNAVSNLIVRPRENMIPYP